MLKLKTVGSEESKSTPLTVADIEQLDSGEILRPPVIVDIIKLKYSHHEMARLLALGMKAVDVARVTGYVAQTVYNLQKTPAFQELVSHYMMMRDDQIGDLSEQIRLAAGEALASLQRKVDQDDDIPIGELRQLATNLLDRAGYSPVSRRESRSVHIGLTGDDIAKLKSEAQTDQKVIEGSLSPAEED